MKKIRNVTIFYATALGVLFLLSPLQVFSALPQNLQITLSPPTASFDVSDLDLRDHNNRKITSPAIRRSVRSFYVSTLNRILMECLTPGRRMALAVMGRSWDLVSGWLKEARPPPIQERLAWLGSKKRDTKPVITISARPLTDFFVSHQWFIDSSITNFHHLTSTLLSSTILLL